MSKILKAFAFLASQMRHKIASRMKGQTVSSRPGGIVASQRSEDVLVGGRMPRRCQTRAARGHEINRWSVSSKLEEHLGQSADGVMVL